MSTTTDYQKSEISIKAIKANEVVKPDIPVDVFNAEAEALYHVAMADKESLTARGLNMATIKALPVAAGACRYAEAQWDKERNAKQEAEKRWKEQSPEAYALRDELLDEFEFAFAQDSALISVVNRIKDDNGHADMIQDLVSLTVLGKDNLKPLALTKFDTTKLDKAESMADVMADLLGQANGTKDENNTAKLLRDQAFTYLKQYVDEVRRYGKFVFRNDKEHVGKYASEYKRN
ncbi:MAG: hypothetical protein PF517_09200 [Salinivirgaceae bacterium]|jgi:hypothetical protein|nr:hypothetical protein [Salinivirgaceae bacterium]